MRVKLFVSCAWPDVEHKKIGVHRPHGDMLPGNSFPQICVVSVNSIVEIAVYHKST